MFQPATGVVTCSICNASYQSETKLLEHQRTAHRGGGSMKKPEPPPREERSGSPNA